MKLLLSLVVAFTTINAFSAVNCTKEPKDKWLDQAKFKTDRETEGYKIKVFKVTAGNCYEIYGTNKEGKKVEIYFNPTNADKVKEEIK